MLDLLAERESLYQKLTHTNPENLMRKFAQYTIDPYSRYPNLHLNVSMVTSAHCPVLNAIRGMWASYVRCHGNRMLSHVDAKALPWLHLMFGSLAGWA